MRILILNQAFYPDVVSTAQHAADLATGLKRAGHEVTVVCSSRGYDDPQQRFPEREFWNGIRILRLRSTAFGKGARWRRTIDFATFMMSCVTRLCLLPKVDLVVAMTSPPLISFIAALAVPHKARRLVFWCMDLNPDEAIAAEWLRQGSITERVLTRVLQYSLEHAHRVIVLDRFMRQRIEAKGIPSDKISVVPPWSHSDYVRFDPEGREAFRGDHHLSGKFVVMYSGNHSPCHPLETLLQAVEQLRDRDDLAFCFVGGGSEFRKVQNRAQDRALQNVLTLPYQPMEKLSRSLSAADLQVVVMGDPYVGIVHPCKIYDVLAVERPLLYIGPAESHVPEIIGKNRVGAYFCSHGDVDGVVRSILQAIQDRSGKPSWAAELGDRFSSKALVPQMVSAIERCMHADQSRLQLVQGSRRPA
jgi:colanic acid biosynthesis glycosyl transferase WcaI